MFWTKIQGCLKKGKLKKKRLGEGGGGQEKDMKKIRNIMIKCGQKNGYRALNGLTGEKQAIVGFV